MQRALAYFGRAGWDRLLKELEGRYVALGRVGGSARLENPRDEEIEALRGFLGKAPKLDRQGRLQVGLPAFEERLKASVFQCTLPDLLAAYLGRAVVTASEAERHESEAFARFLTSAAKYFKEGPGLGWWERVCACNAGSSTRSLSTLQLIRREWNKERNDRAPGTTFGGDLAEGLLLVGKALATPPLNVAGEAERVRLAVFAARVAGDPHAFDMNSLAGRLLERAVIDLHPDPETLLMGLETPVVQRDAVLRSAGILRDDVSSAALVWGLYASVGRQNPLPPGVAYHLPLREVDRLSVGTPYVSPVFIVENPVVFSELLESLEARDQREDGVQSRANASPRPTLICTSGQLSLAAVGLLEKLVEAGASLYYSGDFDDAGLLIAGSVLRRFPTRCTAWRMTVADYDAACRGCNGGVTLTDDERGGLERHINVFPNLVRAMLDRGVKAYQEGIVGRLQEDVIEVQL